MIFLSSTTTLSPSIHAANVTNNTVIAVANVSNTEPNITSVTVDDDIAIPANEIDLDANGTVRVTCNATIFDYNGNQDIIGTNNTNASLFIAGHSVDDPTDNNHKYTNSSCGRCIAHDSDPLVAHCDCRFGVQYYANASSNWVCQFTVKDDGGFQQEEIEINLSDTQNSSAFTVREVLGIDVSPTVLDYGNLSVSETSDEVLLNVSNVGNVPLNFSLRGYGGENETVGQNVSMICDNGGNISIGHQRYEFGSDIIGTTNFNTMINLTNQSINVNATIPQRINDALHGRAQNATIWRLNIPLGVAGLCNGTIIFSGRDATLS